MTRVIRFVEGKEEFGACCDGLVSGSGPVVDIVGAETPEHGGVVEGRRDGGGSGAPVIGPGNLGVS